jgi:anti-anti-sigma factor
VPSAAPTPFSVEVEDGSGDPLIVRVQGDLDLESAPSLAERVLEALHRRGDPRLVLDLQGIGFLDSSGLRVLIRLARELGAAGGGIALATPGRNVRRVLALGGVDRVLPVASSLEQARGLLARVVGGGESEPEAPQNDGPQEGPA